MCWSSESRRRRLWVFARKQKPIVLQSGDVGAAGRTRRVGPSLSFLSHLAQDAIVHFVCVGRRTTGGSSHRKPPILSHDRSTSIEKWIERMGRRPIWRPFFRRRPASALGRRRPKGGHLRTPRRGRRAEPDLGGKQQHKAASVICPLSARRAGARLIGTGRRARSPHPHPTRQSVDGLEISHNSTPHDTLVTHPHRDDPQVRRASKPRASQPGRLSASPPARHAGRDARRGKEGNRGQDRRYRSIH